jgi:hypothetical protein
VSVYLILYNGHMKKYIKYKYRQKEQKGELTIIIGINQ